MIAVGDTGARKMQSKNTPCHLRLSSHQEILAERPSPAWQRCKRRRKTDQTRAIGIQIKLEKILRFRWTAWLQMCEPEADQPCCCKLLLAGEKTLDGLCCNGTKHKPSKNKFRSQKLQNANITTSYSSKKWKRQIDDYWNQRTNYSASTTEIRSNVEHIHICSSVANHHHNSSHTR